MHAVALGTTPVDRRASTSDAAAAVAAATAATTAAAPTAAVAAAAGTSATARASASSTAIALVAEDELNLGRALRKTLMERRAVWIGDETDDGLLAAFGLHTGVARAVEGEATLMQVARGGVRGRSPIVRVRGVWSRVGRRRNGNGSSVRRRR